MPGHGSFEWMKLRVGSGQPSLPPLGLLSHAAFSFPSLSYIEEHKLSQACCDFMCLLPTTRVFNVIDNLRPFSILLPLPLHSSGYRCAHHCVWVFHRSGSEGFLLHFQPFGLRLSQVNESFFHLSRFLRGSVSSQLSSRRGDFLYVFIDGTYLIVV